jgi:hypothetical protein
MQFSSYKLINNMFNDDGNGKGNRKRDKNC